MDHSFGYNAQSTEDDFVSRDELLWSMTDIASKGGNLLLNVGPRAVDARIPDEQLVRLRWLADYVPPNGDAVFGTRPWSTPGTVTVEGDPLRFTARDDEVFAFVRSSSTSVIMAEVVPTASTSVRSVDGHPLEWSTESAGLRVALPPSTNGDPVVVVLRHVDSRGSS